MENITLNRNYKNKLLFCNVFAALSSIFYIANVSAAASSLPPIPVIDPGRVSERLPAVKPQDISPRAEMLQKKEQPKAPLTPEALKAIEAVKFKLNSIIVNGATIYKAQDFVQYYAPYLGKQVSLIDLQKIADAITAHYRKNGYVISRAILPAQRVKGGVVHIAVVEGFISEVYIEGEVNKGARSRLDAYAEKIKQLRPLQIAQLERYMLLLNDLPGLAVKTVLSPSTTELGAAELTMIAEQRKATADVAYDNLGSRYMGPHEAFANVEVDDVTHAADKVLLQTVDTPNNDELRFTQFSYERPLGTSGLSLSVVGNLAETNPGFVLTDFDLVGRSREWSVGLSYPLLRSRDENLRLYGKFDWLDSYTNFASTSLFLDHIRSVRFGVSYDFSDKWRGFNLINVDLSKGLGMFGASPLEPQTPLSRYHGRSDYSKITMDISRYQPIARRYLLLASIFGQYSFNNQLLSAEEFSFGGSQFGRGYDSSEITGDSGVAGKLEFRVDTYPDWRYLQQIQYYAFYDGGVVWNIGEGAFQPNRESGTSAGGGLHTNFNRVFYGNLEAAKPLTRQVDTQAAAGHDGNAWRFYFGLGMKL